MTRYPCRSCGVLKDAKEVMCRFKTYNSPVLRVRWRMCQSCRKEAQKGYKKGRVASC